MMVAVLGALGFAGCKENDGLKESKRLEFELNYFGDAYSVVGIGHCTDSKIVIPREYRDLPVTSIDASAFYGCIGLKSVVIPDSVTSIGDCAFYSCTDLTSVTISKNITRIGDNAFLDCYRLVEVYNKSPLNIIAGSTNDGYVGYYAKNVYTPTNGESKLTTDENGYTLYTDKDIIALIRYVGEETDLILPNHITEIHQYTFQNRNLTSVTLGGSVTSIGEWAFSNCHELTSITIPDSVTSIKDYAFRNCSNLTSLTLGDSVTSIGKWAFSGCRELKRITIPDSVTSIKDYAFRDCNSLTSVTLGNSVTSIDEGVFYNCSSLRRISIPDSIRSIHASTFSGCIRLRYNEKDQLLYLGNSENPYVCLMETASTDITTANIDANCRFIWSGAFYECNNLIHVTIPDNVTTIGAATFAHCRNLTSISLPNSVTSIEDSTFKSCGNLVNITIPESVTSIGSSAFQSCDSLISITLPDSVTSIGEEAFYDCVKLVEVYNKSSLSITIHSSSNGYVGYYAKNIYTPTNGESKLSTDENGYIIYTDETTTTLMSYVGDEIDLILPNGVTHISPKAFYDYDYLTSVIIPDSVTEIGDSAFYGCIGLKSVTLGNGITTIKKYAFVSCNIKSVYIMDIGAWCNITGLNYLMGYRLNDIKLYLQNQLVTELILPETVTSIQNSAFWHCNELTSITLPSGITSIKSMAFGCNNLTTITFNGTIEQWNAIEKEQHWNHGVPATEVVCSDGTVAI